MLWRASPSAPFQPRPAPVPDTDALRKALLQASSQRGRSVARRRLAWRWLLWLGGRYLLPALLVSGLGAWFWLAVLPHPQEPMERSAVPPPTPPAARPAEMASPSVAPAPAFPLPDAESPVRYSPEGEELPTPLQLRFEPAWGNPRQADAKAPPEAPPSPPDTRPQLKPENWLHSKEP